MAGFDAQTIKYRNPRYLVDGVIDVEIDHPEFGWIPFGASPNDCEQYGRDLFARIENDGNIAPYVEPTPE